MNDREKLLRMVQGEDMDSSVFYSINYSLDLEGNITIWDGMEFTRDEACQMDNLSRRVNRGLVPLYEYHRLSPYTARIYQMEQEIDSGIPDEAIVQAYKKFREERPTEGFGRRFLLLHIDDPHSVKDSQGRTLSYDRTDKVEVLNRLLSQEQQTILSLWGIDCPPDINSSENYQSRLSQGRGQVSDWFRQEFIRIGGNIEKLWNR